jgi:hypothetical protein
VLVAHSLGSIVAYDLLQILWGRYGPGLHNSRQEPDVLSALRAVGRHALPMNAAERATRTMSGQARAEFRELQWRAYTALRTAPEGRKPWKVSDFVTCGSPLTHAEFLITYNARDFVRSVEERLVATGPPISETKRPDITFMTDGVRHPHHAAVFAATRWTNIYDKGDGLVTGDPIGGPLGENFGPAVQDVQVRMTWRLWRIFTHTQYWSLDAKGVEVSPATGTVTRSHIEVLRDAVDLKRTLERSPAITPAAR